MSKEVEELRKMLKEFTATEVLFPAIVTAVDTKEDTCDIEAEGEYTDVKLRSIIKASGNRIVVYPKIGSVVLCGKISNTNTIYVLKVSEIDKKYIKIGDTKVVLNSNEIVFNTGLNTTAKADILKTELNKMSNRIDKIIDAINNGAPATGASDGGAALLASIKSSLSSITNKESFVNIENTKIKH